MILSFKGIVANNCQVICVNMHFYLGLLQMSCLHDVDVWLYVVVFQQSYSFTVTIYLLLIRKSCSSEKVIYFTTEAYSRTNVCAFQSKDLMSWELA